MSMILKTSHIINYDTLSRSMKQHNFSPPRAMDKEIFPLRGIEANPLQES